MLFFLFSLFIYDAGIQTFASRYIFANDLDLLTGIRGKWLFSEVEGGIGFDYTSDGFDFGFSDVFVRAGVNRYVRVFDISLYPALHFSGNREEGKMRSFSINQTGFGYGISLGTRISWFIVDMDFEFIEYFSDPVTEHYIFNSGIKFNPDTLTFGLDFEAERFTMSGQTPINSVYIKPQIILSRWEDFSLNFGFAFRLSDKVDMTLANIGLAELGVGAGYYDFPAWKVCFGISSETFNKKSRELFDLRILLIDEEGEPASGLLCLADSGSFQIEEGQMKFSLPEGIYPLSIYSENHLPVDTVVVLKNGTDMLLQLRKKPDYNIVEGEIYDAKTGKPIYAEIRVENSINLETNSNPETGYYRIYLTSGDYVIKVVSDGYYPSVSLVEVAPDKDQKLDFQLLPVKMNR
ncbi:MAG: carboxypeptidase-like regulatory domain-containing protein [candidate division WOR-3 bacterium]